MHPILRDAFREEMRRARQLYVSGDLDRAFALFERAHVLGQGYVIPHTTTHVWMLRIAWRRRDTFELRGQILRILGAMVISRIWVPIGNTGGANVHPLRPMPIAEDLAAVLLSAGRPIVPRAQAKRPRS
jgi:hypothetical protein